MVTVQQILLGNELKKLFSILQFQVLTKYEKFFDTVGAPQMLKKI